MQIEQVKREVSSSGVMKVARATIKATPKIFDMFANDTYADKPLAILRELVANGVDAHVAAGRPDRPVEVQLPTALDPICRIRDYGIGMSRLFVMGDETTPSRFMAYTDGSTKDTDNGQIGGFGIGSKAPLAYVDQFNLRVVYNGELSVYTLFKDEDGIPAIGLQGETTTTEPNGVEISFPVEVDDIEAFHAAAQKALQYFQPLPIVTNGTLNPPDYTYVGNGWAMRAQAGDFGVIMGGVRYPGNSASVGYSLRGDARLSPLLTYGIDLMMPIGSCGVAMSREALSYTSKTTDALRDKLASVIDDVIATFATIFDQAPSEWDAMKMLHAEALGTNRYSARGKLLHSNAKYKGEKLETSFRINEKQCTAVGVKASEHRIALVPPARSRRTATCPPLKWMSIYDAFGITPGEIENVIINDLDASPKHKAVGRIRAFIDKQMQAGTTLVIDGPDVGKMLELLRNPSKVIYSSSLPMPAAPVKVKYDRPRVRMFTFNGERDSYTGAPITNVRPSASKAKAVREIPYADQPARGIMVVLDNFDLPSGFHRKMATGLVSYSDLYFVNQIDAVKIKDNFRNFDDVFDAKLKEALAARPGLPAIKALNNHEAFSGLTGWFDAIERSRPKLTNAQLNRPFGRLFRLWQMYLKGVTEKDLVLANFVTAEMPDRIDPKALRQRLRDEQPDVVILHECLRVHHNTHVSLLIRNL